MRTDSDGQEPKLDLKIFRVMNTNWEHKINIRIKVLPERALKWSICQMHGNELPCCHLFESVDGNVSTNKLHLRNTDVMSHRKIPKKSVRS